MLALFSMGMFAIRVLAGVRGLPALILSFGLNLAPRLVYDLSGVHILPSIRASCTGYVLLVTPGLTTALAAAVGVHVCDRCCRRLT
jgi:hypothetical protein